MAEPSSRLARDWLIVVACLVCQIGMGVGGYVFPVFLKPVVEDLGWSRTAYAFALPVMSTTVALVGPLVGWAADRRGPRPVLIAGSLLMSAGLVGAALMRGPPEFYGIALVIGVAVACLGDLPTGAAIAHRFRERRGLALGMVYIGSNIGGALVPLVATVLAAGASWRMGFGAIGAALWIALLPMALAVGGVRAPRPAEPAEASRVPFDWRALLGQRDFWLLLWVLIAFYLYRLGMNTHLVAFLSDLGYSPLEAAGGFSLALGLGIGGKLCAGAIADRIGARIAVIGTFALIAAASALLLAPRAAGIIPTFLVLHGFATAAEDVVIPLIVAQRFGVDVLGRVYGVLLLALIPGGWIGPILGGLVYDSGHSYAPVFVVFVAVNVSAVLALAAVRLRR